MQATTLYAGDSLSVHAYRCTAGPADKPFVEAHRAHSLSYVRRSGAGLVRGTELVELQIRPPRRRSVLAHADELLRRKRQRTHRLPVEREARSRRGAITGVAGSPTPVGFSFDGMITVSMRGISFMRSTV